MTLAELIDSKLITSDSWGSYEATLLSQAIVAAYLTQEEGIFLHNELRRALQAFVMDGEMHIFYTFTPLYNAGVTDINWSILRREIEGLDESGLRVLQFVGVNPGLVNRMYALSLSFRCSCLPLAGPIAQSHSRKRLLRRSRPRGFIADSMPLFSYGIFVMKYPSMSWLENTMFLEVSCKPWLRSVKALQQA